MAENENVMENEVQPQPKENKPSKGKQVGAAIKEWFRKRIVGNRIVCLAGVLVHFLTGSRCKRRQLYGYCSIFDHAVFNTCAGVVFKRIPQA